MDRRNASAVPYAELGNGEAVLKWACWGSVPESRDGWRCLKWEARGIPESGFNGCLTADFDRVEIDPEELAGTTMAAGIGGSVSD